MSKKARGGKIFVDYFRNGRGNTAIAPYSLRAREISSVAMPLDWRDLKSLKAANLFTLKKAIQYLKKRKSDPWKDYFKTKQKISILG
jgi:bifunctional non-homologous end joining protein LigD